MAEAEIPASRPAEDADEAKRKASEYHRQAPTETETHGMERGPETTSLNEDIQARVVHPHKGDVGRPGTNEAIYQGSKQTELND